MYYDFFFYIATKLCPRDVTNFPKMAHTFAMDNEHHAVRRAIKANSFFLFFFFLPTRRVTMIALHDDDVDVALTTILNTYHHI